MKVENPMTVITSQVPVSSLSYGDTFEFADGTAWLVITSPAGTDPSNVAIAQLTSGTQALTAGATMVSKEPYEARRAGSF